MKKWLTLLTIFALLDTIITYICLWGGLIEAHPVGDYLGFWDFAILKVTIVSIACLALWSINKKQVAIKGNIGFVKKYITGIKVIRLAKWGAMGFAGICLWNTFCLVMGIVG